LTVDTYVYNATGQVFDTSASLDDVRLATRKLIPPGSQGKITLADANAATAFQNQHAKYGVVDHATVSTPTTFKGVSRSATAVGIAGKNIPVV
jgi:hypothetical protein